MKIDDLYEYNKGIQDPNSNAKQSNQNDDEMEMEPFTPDEEKQAAKNLKMMKMAGVDIKNPKMAAKGFTNISQNKKLTPQQMKQNEPMLGKIAQIMAQGDQPEVKPFVNKLRTVFKQFGKVQDKMEEGSLAKKILNKLTSKEPLTKIKKRSKLLKEANPKLFEINFNKKEIAQQGLDAPVKCGFEAETFFYSVDDSRASDDVDNMSVSDVEYEFGDLPDSAYTDYNDWIMEKAMDEYLPDYIDNWIDDNRDEDEFIQDFMNSGNGPTEEGVEEYKEQFAEDDPNEFENREEDGWDDDNWARDLINEEYEAEYEDFLREIANDDDQLRDDAVNECEGDYNMDDWIGDQWYSMSAFLDDYGFEYSSESGSVEGVASELYSGWIQDNSKFDEYPEYGEYGSTGVTDRWAVETDSSIDPDEGAGAELISPVFSNAREMLKEMKSLFEWSDGEFGTNSTTGLHITMSWQGAKTEPNKLKMAMLIGDEYLLDLFGRLRNSYTRSQYRNVLKYAEELDTGKLENFEKLEAALQKGISKDKFSSINFKRDKDSDSGNELIEFRIAGGRDYNQMYKEVVQACVRYGTIMKAGHEPDAFRKEYIRAVSRLLRKSKEVDPKTAKEFDEINAPIIDSAKELVSKKDYFDVLKSLEISLKKFQQYQDALDPEADKKWKQSVDDYEKGTGRKVGEGLNEEEITGYIEPSAVPPSQHAPAYLKKAQESFLRAVAILAKDISTGTNRGKPNAKSIRLFRDYAKQLKLDDSDIQDLLVQQIDDIRPEYNDKENMALLDKGVKALFKKDLIQKPEFLSPQNVDQILKQVWQFAMSDDKHDNTKLDQLVKLLQKVSPHLEYDEIAKSIESSIKSRQENEFVRYMKSGSYGDKGILKIGKITTPGASEELLKFLEPYSGYKHPTSPTHHVNIRSDDRYSQVFQMRLMQRLRERLEHLKGLEIDDPEKADKIKKQLMDIGFELLEGLKPQPDLWDGENSYRRGSDSSQYLAHRDDLESWNTYMDRLAHIQNEIGDQNLTYNFTSAYDDYVLSGIHLDRYFRHKENDGPIQSHFLKELIKERFAAIKKFYTQFDKIFKGEGFVSLKDEIQAKNTLDRRNRDFEKNVRDNAKAKLNIPSHAYAYIKKDFYDNITDEDYSDRAAYLENHLDDFSEHQNSNRVWVIPAAHWGQAHDAREGLDLIQTLEKNDNYYHTWRKTGYNKILSKFARVHNIPFNDLVYNANKTYIQMGGDEFAKLQNAGIEFTRKGDSRAGVPGQDYLIDPEDLANPISDEPIDRGSAMMWNQSDDEEKEMKRFKAFDWNLYPEKMKGLVAKQLKNMKAEQGYYSFKVALEDVLKKVVDGDIDIALRRENNVDGMAQAAGVEDYVSASSNEVAGATNWNNLARYLKINLGVNDQGVNLLKRVYDQFDSDHNWRPESEPDAIGIKRWAAAVKAAYEYIKDGYNVSAGNYFRKNADGSDGDDVSSIYGNDQSGFDVTSDDYKEAREKYRMFNAMMQNGMQFYMLKPDVNRLVSFLNNKDNDELFKQAVLNRLIRDQENGEPPNDFQGALARGRMDFQGQSESVFDKFDALPLQEQLRIVNESDILEKWSQKYKKSINCSNPKGFSQKAHCAGKKKNEGDVSHSLDRRRAQKGKDKYQKVVDVPVSRTGEKFDKFVVVPSESGKVGHMVGMKNGKAQDLGSTTIDMANALVDAYNRGGFSDLPIQKIDMDERKLSKKEKNKKEKYVKGMKKNKGDFEKRYGADAKAVMYATATKMAKENKINTNMKNVFEQFEKLSIEKQLEILHSPVVEGFFSDLDVDMRELSYKAFAKKYPEYAHLHPGAEELSTKPVKMKKAPYNKEQHIKNTYNKFKQQHGEAKAKIMLDKMMQRGYFDKDMSESLLGIDILTRTKKLTENMPNNNKLAILKRLLSKHFPVGDMDMQFQAYLALPIPSMMTAFSRLKSINGPDACARDILSHYAKNRLPDEEVKQLNLNESYIREDAEEDRLDRIMSALKDNPKFAQRVYKMLKLEKGAEDGLDIEDRLLNKDTGEEKDHRINKNILRKLVLSLGQLDHDFDEINAFVETYGYADYVNTALLNKSGVFTIKDMLVGSDQVSKEFIYDLYESLYDFKISISNSNRGPGELGLALLSPNVEIATLGDIKVNGEEIEVKGEVSTGGGRMVNGIDDFKFSGLEQVKSQLAPFYEKHDIPDEDRIYNLKGTIAGGRKPGQAHILDQAKIVEQIKPGAGAEFLKLVVSTYQFVVDSEEEAELTNSFMTMDKERFLTLVGRMSFKNYAYMLNKKGFNRMLFLNWIKDKVVSCTTDEFPKYSDHLRFTSLDMADSQNGPAVQVSIQ